MVILFFSDPTDSLKFVDAYRDRVFQNKRRSGCRKFWCLVVKWGIFVDEIEKREKMKEEQERMKLNLFRKIKDEMEQVVIHEEKKELKEKLLDLKNAQKKKK